MTTTAAVAIAGAAKKKRLLSIANTLDDNVPEPELKMEKKKPGSSLRELFKGALFRAPKLKPAVV